MATIMLNYPTFCIFRFFESENLLSDTQERITARLRAELSVSVTYLSWQMMVKAKKVKLFGRKGLLILQQASHTRPDLIYWRKLLKKKRKGKKKKIFILRFINQHVFISSAKRLIALLLSFKICIVDTRYHFPRFFLLKINLSAIKNNTRLWVYLFHSKTCDPSRDNKQTSLQTLRFY